MTQLTTLEKQSYEKRLFEFDLSGLMDAAATISTVVSVVSVNQNLVGGSSNVTISGEVASGQSVKAFFEGGTSQELYKITCKAVDSTGQNLEWDGFLAVRDV